MSVAVAKTATVNEKCLLRLSFCVVVGEERSGSRGAEVSCALVPSRRRPRQPHMRKGAGSPMCFSAIFRTGRSQDEGGHGINMAPPDGVDCCQGRRGIARGRGRATRNIVACILSLFFLVVVGEETNALH